MFDKEILEYENQLLHDEVDFEQACYEQTLNLRRIKNKLVFEDAIMESADVEELYLAEAKETKNKKQGIISRLIDTIKNFIKKIINKITGGKFEAKADKKVPGNPQELIKYGRQLMMKAKTALTSPTAAKIGKAAGITAGAAAATGGTLFVISKAKQGPTLKEIREFMNDSTRQLNACQQIVNGNYVGNADNAQAYINEFGTITSRLSKIMNAIMSGGELDTRSKDDIRLAEDGKSRLNGMTTEELKKKYNQISEEIDIITKRSKSLSVKYKQMKSAHADKSGYTGTYIGTRREADAERLAKLQNQLTQVKSLLAASATRDARRDDVDLNKKEDSANGNNPQKQ